MRCPFRAGDLHDGEVRDVALDGGGSIAVLRAGGRICAIDDQCPHGEGRLFMGEVDGLEIVCPHHRGAFDIRTGAPTRPPCLSPVRTYPLVIDADGAIEVDIDD